MPGGGTTEASRVQVTFFLLIWMAFTQVHWLWKFLFYDLCTFLYIYFLLLKSLLNKGKLGILCLHLCINWKGPVEGRERRNLMECCPEEVGGMRSGHRWEGQPASSRIEWGRWYAFLQKVGECFRSGRKVSPFLKAFIPKLIYVSLSLSFLPFHLHPFG